MVSTEKWNGVIGGSSGWNALFGTEINTALANGSTIMGSSAIVNDTDADIFFDISWISGASTTITAAGYLAFWLLPLLHDGTTYADGRWSTSATAGQPGGNYWLDNMQFTVVSAGVLSGCLLRLVMPKGTWKPAVTNLTTVALASTNACQWRIFDRGIG